MVISFDLQEEMTIPGRASLGYVRGVWGKRVAGVVATAVASSLVSACGGDTPVDPGFLPSDAGVEVGNTVDASPLGPVTLTVTRVGQGAITSLPSGVDCGATCSTPFPSGTTVVLKAVAAAGWEFGGWSGGTPDGGLPTCAGTGACAITLAADTKITATFFQPKSDLTVTKVGNGTVTSAPAGINCGPTCTAPFDTGSNVTLTATPASGYKFNGWSGACGGVGPCVVAMTGPKTATANFAINYTTWDPAWSLPGINYSNGNRTISANNAGTKHARSVVGRSSGKWYWEVTAIGGDGTTDAGGIGLVEAGMLNNPNWIGSAPSGIAFGYGTCCTVYYMTWAGASLPSGNPPLTSPIKTGNVYMFALDMDLKRAWFGHNGSWYNGGNPGANVAPAVVGLSGTVHAGVTFYSSSINAFTANFGQAAFSYGVPAGFNAGLY